MGSTAQQYCDAKTTNDGMDSSPTRVGPEWAKSFAFERMLYLLWML